MYKNHPIHSRAARPAAFAQTTTINRAARRRRLLFILAAACGLQLLVPAAQATLKRALFYGPTTDTNMGVAEKFVGCCNIADGGHGFAAIGTGSANSQVWTESTWLSKATADFAAFDVIIFGDEPKGSGDGTRWNTAIATTNVWVPAVKGNVLIVGSDPDCHFITLGQVGAQKLVTNAVIFGADQTGYSQHVTGLYVALSAVSFGSFQEDGYFNSRWVAEPVKLLGGLGDFEAVSLALDALVVTGNAASKVASNPILDYFNDSDLSGWTWSAHEGFYSWPAGYLPVAIVADMFTGQGTPGYTAPCPVYSAINQSFVNQYYVNTPLVYMLARGAFNQLTASPCLQANAPGGTCSFTATLTSLPNHTGISGRQIGFKVTSGPNLNQPGTSGTATTASDGHVTFSYVGRTGSPGVGQDSISVFLDNNGNGQLDSGEAVTTPLCNWGNTIVTVSATLPNAAENPLAYGNFRISRTGSISAPSTVYFVMTGTALLDTGQTYLDYTLSPITTGGVFLQTTIPVSQSFVDVTLTPLDDSYVEPVETATLVLQDLDPTDHVVGTPLQATVQITSDDAIPTVTVTAPTAHAKEAGPLSQSFTFSRTGSTASQLTIFYVLPVGTGSALLGWDYTIGDPSQQVGLVTIPVNASSVDLVMTPVQDSRKEGTESVLLNIVSFPAYALGTSYSATIYIDDDDNIALPLNYTITDIGQLYPYYTPSYAFGVNNNTAGKITGSFQRTSTSPNDAFSWLNGTLTDLSTLTNSSGAYTYGMAINDSGMVVGYGLYAAKDQPFYWVSGVGLTRLDLIDAAIADYGNKAVAVNNANRIVGFCDRSLYIKEAVAWDNSTTVFQMGNLANNTASKLSYANGVNTSGRIVGKSMILSDSTTYHAFRTLADHMFIRTPDDDLGTMVGGQALNSEATAINDLDEVVGGSVATNGQYHAFWKAGNTGMNGGYVDLGVLSGDNYSVAQAINASGTIVGYSKKTSTGVQRAFVSYNDGSMYDLITKVSNATGWTLQVAEGINANGWIVGNGTRNGMARGFLLTPNN